MAYNPTNWVDRAVQRPRTFEVVENGDDTITLIPQPGQIFEPGTPVDAVNMNKIEQGIVAIEKDRKLITYTSLADLGLTSASFNAVSTEEKFFETIITKMADNSQLTLMIQSNNDPINNIPRFLPGAIPGGAVNGILEIIKGNTGRTSVTYQFSTTSSLGGASAIRYIGTYVYNNPAPNRAWSGWERIETRNADGTGKDISGTNLNELFEPGDYQGNNLIGAPNTAAYYFVEVKKWNASGSTVMTHLTRNSLTVHEKWWRIRNGGTWSPWIDLFHSGRGQLTVTGSYPGYNADATSGWAEFIGLLNGVRKSMLQLGENPELRKLDGQTILSRLRLETTAAFLNNSEMWTAANNPSNKGGSSGFQRLQSGIVIQWGYSTPPTPGTYSHTFPLAFSSVIAIVATPLLHDGEDGSVTISSRTKTNFKVNLNYPGPQGTARGYSWIAVGYI